MNMSLKFSQLPVGSHFQLLGDPTSVANARYEKISADPASEFNAMSLHHGTKRLVPSNHDVAWILSVEQIATAMHTIWNMAERGYEVHLLTDGGPLAFSPLAGEKKGILCFAAPSRNECLQRILLASNTDFDQAEKIVISDGKGEITLPAGWRDAF